MAAEETEKISEFEKLLKLYDYSFKKGDIIKGKVIGYERGGLMVDIGAKTAAVVPSKEVSIDYAKSAADIAQIGDEKEFIIIRDEDEEGQLTLSLKRVAAAYSWSKLEAIKEEDSVVEAEVMSTVKGGVLVDVLGLRGFVPASHIRARDPEALVGQKIQLKVLSVEPKENNLIMSQRKALSDQQAEQRKDVFGKLEVGQVVEGEVVRLADFGAFIDIGGIDGLLPLSQMSWRWVDHPSDVIAVGDKINVEIIGIDLDKQRVSLSLKSLQPDPWMEVAKTVKEGEKISGNVIRLKHFGAFVEVYPGVEALLPQKEVLEYQAQTGKSIDVGSTIETTVTRFNPEDRRISLSITGSLPEDGLKETEKMATNPSEFEEENPE